METLHVCLFSFLVKIGFVNPIRSEITHPSSCLLFQKWCNAGLCDDLVLPPKNEFIPTDFNVLPVDPDVSLYFLIP